MQKRLSRTRLTALALLTVSMPCWPAGLALTQSAAADPIYSALTEGWVGDSFVFDRSGSAVEGGERDSLATFGAELRGAVASPSGFFLQGDLIGEHTTAGTAGNNNFRYADTLGGHLGYRSSQFLLGALGAYGQAYAETNSAHYWAVGAEGRYYCDDIIWAAQVGYFDATDDEGSERDFIYNGFFVRPMIKYALTSEAQLSGELSYASTDEQDRNADIFGWGARYDRQIDHTAVSLFVAYNGTYYDNGLGNYVDNVARVGLQLSFGPGDKTVDRRDGATLDLPYFGRWVAAGNSID